MKNNTLYVVNLTADYGDSSVESHLVGVFDDEKFARQAMLKAAKNEEKYLIEELDYNPDLVEIQSCKENHEDQDGYNIYSDDEYQIIGKISQVTLTKALLNNNLSGIRGEQTAFI